MELRAQHRTVLGKKVGTLRRQGITPGNVFGSRMESLAVQVTTRDLLRLLHAGGRNALITLGVEGPGTGPAATHNVLLRAVQHDPVDGRVLHVDFYRVHMDEPVEMEVPINLLGTSPAAGAGLGTLVQAVNTLNVRALPAMLPTALEVDITVLVETRQAIHAGDIPLPPGVTLASDPDQVVVSVTSARGQPEGAEPGASPEGRPPLGAPQEGGA